MNNQQIDYNYKTESMVWLQKAISELEDNRTILESLRQGQCMILNDLAQNIEKYDNILERLKGKLSGTKDEIRKIISSNNINDKKDLEEQRKQTITIENNIKQYSDYIDKLNDKYQKVSLEIENLNQIIRDNEEDKYNMNVMYAINDRKEGPVNLKLSDLVICPDGIKELVESYNNPNIPKKLLDKIVFFKGGENTGKHSVIQAMGNELNRPVFVVKHEDYMSDRGLDEIFKTLIENLRVQRKIKNEKTFYYDNLLSNLNSILQSNDPQNFYINILNGEGEEEQVDITNQQGRTKLLNIIEQGKNDIDTIEDSCILYIEDFDRIVQSTIYDKGELLEPIKSVIRQIKAEEHEVLLILVGNNPGANHANLKDQIDCIFEFKGLENNHQEVFQKFIDMYCSKFNIDNTLQDLSIDTLPDKYKNIKELDRLAKIIIRKKIQNDTPITQEYFDQVLKNFTNGKKNLFDGIGLT